MLAKLKKKFIAVLDVVDGVRRPDHFLARSDIDQMRRIMVR